MSTKFPSAPPLQQDQQGQAEVESPDGDEDQEPQSDGTLESDVNIPGCDARPDTTTLVQGGKNNNLIEVERQQFNTYITSDICMSNGT